MALSAFKRLVTSAFELNQIQANVAAIFQQINLNPFVTGAYVTDQTLTTGSTKVPHGLGRVPQGWIVTARNANATIWQTSMDDKFLTVSASAACKADFWVF